MEPLLHAGEAHLQSHMHRPAKKLTTYGNINHLFVKSICIHSLSL